MNAPVPSPIELQLESILVVDDEPDNRALICNFLEREGYAVREAGDGQAALGVVARGGVDLVLLDLMMPGMDGIEVCRRIRQSEVGAHLPVIIITASIERELRVAGKRAGCDDYLAKPIDFDELGVRLRNLLVSRHYAEHLENTNQSLEQAVRQRTIKLRQAYLRLKEVEEETRLSRQEMIQRLARAAEFRDDDTANHVERMSHYCALIARQMGEGDERCQQILLASKLHDVGKIAIPDLILKKPGKLSPAEFEVIKTHSQIGYRILEGSRSKVVQLGATIALTHHEKYNGNGYPQGLRGESIPLAGRICAVADVFDALTSKRVYKDAIPVDEALGILTKERGQHFDPRLVDAFIAAMPEVLTIKEQHADRPIALR